MEFQIGQSVRFFEQTVTIASIHEYLDGEKTYLCEFPDHTFTRLRGDVLKPVPQIKKEYRDKAKELWQIACSFTKPASPKRRSKFQ